VRERERERERERGKKKLEILNWGMHGWCCCNEKPAYVNSNIILLNILP
jgi:hypothetical protein